MCVFEMGNKKSGIYIRRNQTSLSMNGMVTGKRPEGFTTPYMTSASACPIS